MGQVVFKLLSKGQWALGRHDSQSFADLSQVGIRYGREIDYQAVQTVDRYKEKTQVTKPSKGLVGKWFVLGKRGKKSNLNSNTEFDFPAEDSRIW